MRFLSLFLMLGVALMLRATPAAAETLAAVAPVHDCDSLRGFDPALPDFPTQITDTATIHNSGQPYCRVRGIIAPSIHFEVRLPIAGWTQRYLQTGCGGLCGMLDIRAPQRACPAQEDGAFAMASTDMGHTGMSSEWAANNLQLQADFAYRGMHATAVVSKALIARFYGQPAKWSYFSGCSDGGREALMEAQRFPDDFDGIAAGAAALNFQVQNSFYHGWNAQTVLAGGHWPRLTSGMLTILHEAALKACDAQDGLADGIISSPLACRFDPHSIICRNGATSDCLTPDAADAAAEIYAGAHDAQGQKLVVGGPLPGSELAWRGVFVPRFPLLPIMSATIASDAIRTMAFPKPMPPGWSLADFRFTAETMDQLRQMHGLYDATDPDLHGFAARNGKLLMWHGLADPHIAPTNSIAYVQAVTDLMGEAATKALVRLFLVPGMYHCGDGDGLTSIDVLTPLMAWTEDGQAPDRIVASRDDAAARAGKGRAIFPFPATPRLRDGGNAENPNDWTAEAPAVALPKFYANWLGAAFFTPGHER